VAYLLCVVTDITKQKRTAEALLRYTLEIEENRERLREREDMLDERATAIEASREENEKESRTNELLLAQIGHELRTPLTAILGFADALTSGGISPDQVESTLESIHRSGRHLLQFINDILDISQIQAGALKVFPGPTAVRALVAEFQMMLRSMAVAKGLDLRIEFANGTPGLIMTDETRLRQILINLVGNAIKYTEEGNVELRIAPEGGIVSMIRFDVIDMENGNPADLLPRLFAPFTQASSPKSIPGAGLGLAISRSLARLLGGELGLAAP
jgi:two-component system, sensor histidine kinase and response regulator